MVPVMVASAAVESFSAFAFAEARNVFDEHYATRGIFAGSVFVTPAPDRRYYAGAEWSF